MIRDGPRKYFDQQVERHDQEEAENSFSVCPTLPGPFPLANSEWRLQEYRLCFLLAIRHSPVDNCVKGGAG